MIRNHTSEPYASGNFVVKSFGACAQEKLSLPASAYHTFVVFSSRFPDSVRLAIGEHRVGVSPGASNAYVLYAPPFLDLEVYSDTPDTGLVLQVLDRPYHRLLDASVSCVSKGALLNHGLIEMASTAPVDKLFQNLVGTSSSAEVEYEITAFLREVLSEGCRRSLGGEVLSVDEESHRIDHQKITNFMWHNLEQQVSLDQLSGLAFQSKFHFLRCFKSLTGHCPLTFVRLLRVFKARNLLNAPDGFGSMADIALECGFSDQAHLSRTFKKQTGMTPTAYRKIMDAASGE